MVKNTLPVILALAVATKEDDTGFQTILKYSFISLTLLGNVADSSIFEFWPLGLPRLGILTATLSPTTNALSITNPIYIEVTASGEGDPKDRVDVVNPFDSAASK